MPSPFPGIDPYLEAPGRWEDFHDSFLTYCRDAMLQALAPSYLVRIEERIASISVPDGERKGAVLDLGITTAGDYQGRNGQSAGGVATLDAVEVEHEYFEPLKESYLEILRAPDRKLICVIELLSPGNKENPGRNLYLAKREALLSQYVHIVEIDLLYRGQRLPMKKPLPPGDFFVFVSRAERRFFADVLAWTVRQPLPTIPIPLQTPDPDYRLSLATLFQQAYDRGRYDLELDYKREPPSFLRPEDQEWTRGIVTQHA